MTTYSFCAKNAKRNRKRKLNVLWFSFLDKWASEIIRLANVLICGQNRRKAVCKSVFLTMILPTGYTIVIGSLNLHARAFDRWDSYHSAWFALSTLFFQSTRSFFKEWKSDFNNILFYAITLIESLTNKWVTWVIYWKVHLLH